MISIRNLNSYIPSSSTQNSFPPKKNTPISPEPQQITKNELILTASSLSKYTEIAESNFQNTRSSTQSDAITNIRKDSLSFSTLSAISQYTRNANLEQIEKANAMLSVSLYA